MDITKAYFDQFKKNKTYITLPSGKTIPRMEIQPGLNVFSRIFLRADNVPEFYITLSDPLPEDTALVVMPDGRAVLVPSRRIEDAELDEGLSAPAGAPFFPTLHPIVGMPGERMGLTKPLPRGKILLARARRSAVLVDLPEEAADVHTENRKGVRFVAAICLDPETKEVFISTPPQVELI